MNLFIIFDNFESTPADPKFGDYWIAAADNETEARAAFVFEAKNEDDVHLGHALRNQHRVFRIHHVWNGEIA